MPRDAELNSLGFAKPPSETRVVVAMSGGVDSSVVAAMLAEQGYDVVGVTLQLYDHGAALAKKGACCAGRDIHDARRVAEEMGFPHYVLRMQHHLACADPVRGFERLEKAGRDQRLQFRVRVVDVQSLERAVDADAACMPVESGLYGGDAVLVLGREGGMGHEILNFDVAVCVEQPIAVICDLGGFEAGSDLERGHACVSLKHGAVSASWHGTATAP